MSTTRTKSSLFASCSSSLISWTTIPTLVRQYTRQAGRSPARLHSARDEQSSQRDERPASCFVPRLVLTLAARHPIISPWLDLRGG